MAGTQQYVDALRRVCQQAKRSSPFDLTLATSSPGEKFDDDFAVTRGVGGIVTLRVKLGLYPEIEPTLEEVVRKYLRDYTDNGVRVIEFYSK